jgi:hypothetical protein
MIFNKAQALISLCPTASFVMRNNDIEWNDTTQSCPTESELNVEIARLESEYNAKQYQRDRAKEYPAIVDQLDTIFHEGLDAWKAQIQAVKDKYPKA